jgi:hypothetical protein
MADDRAGWWQRNWKWAAPSGCLLVVVLAFGGCLGMVAGLFGVMKNTEPYRDALARAQRSEAVVAAIGEPVEASAWFSGNYTENMGSGSADYAIPLSGPRGEGTLYVEARKREGRWHFIVLSFAPDGGEPIDLLDDAERGSDDPIRADDDPTAFDTLDEDAVERDIDAVDFDADEIEDAEGARPDEAPNADGSKPLRHGAERPARDDPDRSRAPPADDAQSI